MEQFTKRIISPGIVKETEVIEGVKSVFSITGNISEEPTKRYELPYDMVITHINIIAPFAKVYSLIPSEADFTFLPAYEDKFKLTIENIDRVIIDGSLGVIYNVFSFLNPYTHMHFNINGTKQFYLIPPNNNVTDNIIGYQLPVPLRLKKGDTIKIEFDRNSGLVELVNAYCVSFYGYQSEVKDRKILYARTQEITKFGNLIQIPVPKTTLVYNIGFEIFRALQDANVIYDYKTVTSTTLEPKYYAYALNYISDSKVEVLYGRGGTAVRLAEVSGLLSLSSSKWLFNVKQTVKPTENILIRFTEGEYPEDYQPQKISKVAVYYDYELID